MMRPHSLSVFRLAGIRSTLWGARPQAGHDEVIVPNDSADFIDEFGAQRLSAIGVRSAPADQ